MGLSIKVQRWLACTSMLFGLVLLLYMIVVEDEPGAVPLVMLVGGGLWLWRLRRKAD